MSLKVKTFTFEDDSIFKYNRWYEEENRLDMGEYYYYKDVDKIDDTINNFILCNNLDVVDIKVNSIVKGNNPPTSILVYTIVYKRYDDELTFE